MLDTKASKCFMMRVVHDEHVGMPDDRVRNNQTGM